jgi:hypothetical protein
MATRGLGATNASKKAAFNKGTFDKSATSESAAAPALAFKKGGKIPAGNPFAAKGGNPFAKGNAKSDKGSSKPFKKGGKC